MLKVLIADDERKVMQLIEYLVEWETFGMEISYRANDGKKALETILTQNPDVVITDIRMPVINGIELVRRTREAGLSPFFIIISGYSEFEYAQKAIQMGVEDYLLKPLKKKDLEQVLSKISGKHRHSSQTDAEKQELISQLSREMKKSKGSLLTDIIVKKSSVPYSMSASQFLEEYGFSLHDASLECLVTHVFTGHSQEPSSNEEQYRFLLPKIQDALEAKLALLCYEVINTIYNNEIITLLIHNPFNRTVITEELQKLKVTVLNYRSIYPSLQLAIGISSTFPSIDQLPGRYLEAKRALLCRFCERNSLILEHPDFRINHDPDDRIITPADRKNMLGKIELLDIDGFRQLLALSFDKIEKNIAFPAKVSAAFESMYESFSFGLQSLDEIPPELISAAEELRSALECFYLWEELKNYWIDTACAILASYAEARKSQEDKPIRQAKQYIQNHYNEALSLEAVSSVVGFNPAYFSTIFKKSTGQNFMDYVKEIRISNAKDLLIHTNRDIAEIAQQVGYSDIKYFSRLFRKITQLTPSDYRKLYG